MEDRWGLSQRILPLVMIITMVQMGQAQEVSRISVHDPVMIQSEGKYYLFCTGKGIAFWSSTDMQHWTRLPSVFAVAPSWTESVVPGFKNHIWAPDISFHNGLYYLYYSVSAFAKNTSAIGVATNVTLDPENPAFCWQDHGIVIQSHPHRDLWNAIDPHLIVDSAGVSWLSFGSFWEGLKLVKMSEDRLSIAEPQVWHTLAKRVRSPLLPDQEPGDAAIEAPFIFEKNGYYYLFASFDYCCRGEESTYKMVMGRSKSVTGPYLDQAGLPMTEGGGSLLLEGNQEWAGVGHNSAYTFEGKDYLVFHGYEAADEGRPKLHIRELAWNSNGWPFLP